MAIIIKYAQDVRRKIKIVNKSKIKKIIEIPLSLHPNSRILGQQI